MKEVIVCFLCCLLLAKAACAVESNVFQTSKSLPECPAESFSDFLSSFADSATTQLAFTRFPLEKQEIDLDATPEPKPFLRVLREDQVGLPLIPNSKQRKAENLHFKVNQSSNGKIKVTLIKDDTGYQVVYFFNRENRCWVLVRVEDWSI